jgi:pimeloyl-ACP methyl ester carboxylesterase
VTTTTSAEPITNTISVPGATLTYDVRLNEESTKPVLFLIGAPMGAGGFPTLASHFTDRTVVTYDPRGTERSTIDDPASEIDPEIHAADVHAVIKALNVGSVDMFASSGGAVTALALVAKHPDDVLTVVVHEPPLASLLPDREHALATTHAIHETYQQKGGNWAMAHFIAVVSHQGEFTAEVVAQPAPDPSAFGMPTEDDGDRSDAMLAKTILTIPSYEPDFETLRGASTRIIPAAGEDEPGTMAARGARAVAERLGVSVTEFPGGHGGFIGGEYGQMGKPDEFAAKLHEVLDA